MKFPSEKTVSYFYTGRYRNRSKSYVYTRLDQLWEEQYTNLKSNDEKAIWTLTKVAEQNRINEVGLDDSRSRRAKLTAPPACEALRQVGFGKTGTS